MRPLVPTALLTALAATGCGAADPETLFSSAPWPSDHAVVALPIDATGVALGEPRLYAPGAPIQWRLDEAERLRLLTFADGEHLERCGVTLSSERARLPAPDAQFEVVGRDGDDLDLVATDAAAPPLHFARCAPPESAPECPLYEVQRYDATAAPDQDPVALAESSEGLMIALSDRTRDTQPHLLRRQDGELAPLPPDPAFGPHGLRALERVEERTFALSPDGVFEVDAEGAATRIGDAPHEAAGLLVLDAETIAAFGPRGLTPVVGDVPPITDAVTTAWSGGHPQTGVFAFAVTDYAILRLKDGAWVTDHRLVDRSWQVLGGDASAVFAGNQVGEVLLRRGPEDWELLGVPPGRGSRIRTIIGIGSGRAMIGGNDGLLATWSAEGWCAVPPFVVTPIVDLHFGRSAVYAASRHVESLTGDAGALFRISIAPP